MANEFSAVEDKYQSHPKLPFSEYLELGKGKALDYLDNTVWISPQTQQRINRFLLRKSRFGYFNKRRKFYKKVNRHRKTDHQAFLKNLKVESGRLSYRPNH